MDLKKYIIPFFSKKKLKKNISFFAFWDSKCIIPNNVYIGATARLMNTSVGKYTRIKPGCVLKNAVIGSFCSIANNVMIGLGKHPTNLLSTNSIFYRTGIRSDWAKPIDFKEELTTTIGNDVWIGNGAVIMDGVNVGDGAIIGSRAVVTKDVPPYGIVGGIPAKIIKYRFDEETIRLLLDIKWWDKSDDDISQLIKAFTIPYSKDNNLIINILQRGGGKNKATLLKTSQYKGRRVA